MCQNILVRAAYLPRSQNVIGFIITACDYLGNYTTFMFYGKYMKNIPRLILCIRELRVYWQHKSELRPLVVMLKHDVRNM